jgi:outer membrane protein assembly factor BamE (lipoprotein component of BamABCDE complex)
MTAQQHQAQVDGADKNKLTVGTVQKEIRVGMSGDEVVSALGSPNMVTTDDKRQESWVYDRFSTENVYSKSSGGVGLLLIGVGSAAGARSTTQRTLTVVIKFDGTGHVRDFAYRQSSF